MGFHVISLYYNTQTLHVRYIYLHWGGLRVNVGIYTDMECLGYSIPFWLLIKQVI